MMSLSVVNRRFAFFGRFHPASAPQEFAAHVPNLRTSHFENRVSRIHSGWVARVLEPGVSIVPKMSHEQFDGRSIESTTYPGAPG